MGEMSIGTRASHTRCNDESRGGLARRPDR